MGRGVAGGGCAGAGAVNLGGKLAAGDALAHTVTMRRIVLLTALLLAAGLAPAQDDLEALRATVVQVFNVSQAEDYSLPWQRPQPQRSTGTAFYIGNKTLLTNAHVVSDARNLLVKRGDRPDRVEARVVFAGHDCDLAALTVDDPQFFEGMEPLAFGGLPELRSTVVAIGYPMGGSRITVTQGVVSRIEVQSYSHSRGDQHLAVQVDAAINHGNSGGPLLQDGKVVGVAFQMQAAGQNIGYMIPVPVISHFLTDIADGQYHGFAELGVYEAHLENAGLREFLGVPEGATGVVVLKPMPYASCEGVLRRNDVLHAIDGIPIRNDGTIQIGKEFFGYEFVVENKQVGETVKLQLRREGKLLEVEVPLKRWGARMPFSWQFDTPPDYLVLGGYLFVPLSLNYLARRGSEELLYYLQNWYPVLAGPDETREQLVVLSRILPHTSTAYRPYNNSIVASVDGKVPRDFRAFVAMLDDATADKMRIEFEGVNVPPLVLDRARIREVHAEICAQYGIRQDRHVGKGN